MIAIINSGVANISSVVFALERIGANVIVTTEEKDIHDATHVILPGVGSAKAAMKTLQKNGLDKVIQQLTIPVLGICLGMQLLYEYSEEDDINCLSVIPGRITKLKTQPQLVIPHMGWNSLIITQESPLLKGIDDNGYAYFVHSYAAPISESTCAACEYGQRFTAVSQWKNFYGTQFHPERSGDIGSRILKNFMEVSYDNLSRN